MLTHSELELRKQTRNDFQVKQTVTTGSAYAANQVLGGKITIDNINGASGPIKEAPLSTILQSLSVLDPDTQNASIDLFFFNQNPTATYTDKTNFVPSLADLQNCIGVVNVPTTAYKAAGANGAVASVAGIGQVLKPFAAAGTALYCIPVVRGTPTFVNGSVWFRFQFSNGL